ncbi:MAG: hypothetical protein FWG05_05305 [Kiritimatiellaeota bacterium]|nr:hypothetical protein [Kiritimatiellota bacterium]
MRIKIRCLLPFTVNRLPLTLFLLFIAAPAFAQETVRTKSGLLIVNETVYPDVWGHGTVINRFVIENPSDRQREVEIKIPQYNLDNNLSSLSGSIIIEAGARAALELPHPAVRSGDGWTVYERGKDSEDFNHGNFYRLNNSMSVLLSVSLSAETMNDEFKGFVSSSSSSSSSSQILSAVRLDRPPEAWPQNWLAYTPFDGVIIHVDDYAKMPDAVKSALVRYAKVGGNVVLASDTEYTEEEDGSFKLVWQSAIPSEWRDGHGDFHFVTPDKSHKSHSSPVGFGNFHLPGFADMKKWDDFAKSELVKTFRKSREIWAADLSGHYYRYGYGSDYHKIEKLLAAIPTGGGADVAVNGFFALLLVFVLLAGPGAVIYFARRNRRIWILWAVPLFSLAFSAVIFAGIYIFEGFTPTVRRQAITLLDQPAKQAATLGAVGVYAPAALRGGLVFDNATEVTPLLYNDIRGARIESGAKQVYIGGWTPPRMSAFFRLRRSETRYEQLMVTENDDGTVEVVNALGADIERLELFDKHLRHHSFGQIKAGAKATLIPSQGKVNEDARDWFWKQTLVKAYGSDPGWDFKNMSDKLFTVHPGPSRTYAAKLSSCPFIEDPLNGRKTNKSEEAIVVGKY